MFYDGGYGWLARLFLHKAMQTRSFKQMIKNARCLYNLMETLSSSAKFQVAFTNCSFSKLALIVRSSSGYAKTRVFYSWVVFNIQFKELCRFTEIDFFMFRITKIEEKQKNNGLIR